MAQAAQGGGAVAIPGGVEELWRCGTEGRGQWAWADWSYLILLKQQQSRTTQEPSWDLLI